MCNDLYHGDEPEQEYEHQRIKDLYEEEHADDWEDENIEENL